ncbi:hypothetical protein OS493_007534 [Desmophyllum pertusum]|uniref:Glycine N-methyltransferase n=1 Tax=Desmophyllum pertusum TaxID=174260 RepID=A0A9X0CU93_9CNID|nr:hypothetical protein OS493_007534 [Desmophyllum pertusum]
MVDSIYRTRSLGIGLSGIPDQYADGKAARVWQHYIGGHKKRTESYKEFFCNLLNENGIKHILDVACGTGVDSIMLLENNFKMTSTDASDKMLKQAWKIRWQRRKEEAFDDWVIEEGNWLALQEANIEVPSQGFDAVICLGNSFAHLPDFHGDLSNQKLAIQNFKDMLKPGGVLFIDHRNYDAILDSGKAPQRNLYYNSDCIESIKTSVLYVDGKESMITLDYTVDPSKASDDFTEEGEEPGAKRRKSSSEGDISKFRLSYCPLRLGIFTDLLKGVFGEDARHEVFGDFEPLGKVELPAYYVHMVWKPTNENGLEEN